NTLSLAEGSNRHNARRRGVPMLEWNACPLVERPPLDWCMRDPPRPRFPATAASYCPRARDKAEGPPGSMDQPVQHITIVGGGAAGWLTAVILRKKLDSGPLGPRVKISLIESPGVGIIGVGEGSLPGFVQELKNAKVDEREFVRRCNAAYKLGVRFVNWNGS